MKNSPPSSAVHSSHHTSSSSLASTQQLINAKVVSVQTEHSVPVKSPSILNSQTAHSPRKETESKIIVVNQLLLPTEREQPHHEADESKFFKFGKEHFEREEAEERGYCGGYTRVGARLGVVVY